MEIEAVTLGQVAALVVFIVALIKGLDFLYAKYKKPTTDLEERITKRLEQMEKDNKMTLRVVIELLQHEVTGNHTVDMEKLYKEVKDYIIEK